MQDRLQHDEEQSERDIDADREDRLSSIELGCPRHYKPPGEETAEADQDADVGGDVVFPPIDWSDFRCVSATPHAVDERNALPFTIERWERA